MYNRNKIKQRPQMNFKEQGYNAWRRNRRGKAGERVLMSIYTWKKYIMEMDWLKFQA